jgi:hypothetical protein
MKFVYIVGISSIVMAQAFAGTNETNANANNQVPVAIAKFVPRPPKKLLDPIMIVMNQALCENPTCTVRTEFACNTAYKTLKELPSMKEDKALVIEKVHSILASLKQFFKLIHNFKAWIEPLLEESLLSNLQGKEREALKQQSVLMGFIAAKAEEKDSYFEHRVQTKEALENLCNEFIIFFADLTESLSPEARNEYLKVRAQFVKKSK